ncbi:MAG: HAD family phosphatase [Elusimicrobia bacterium]|nr:HAD family phosphatase [Elusimicrobiota bacterium]MDE2238132.1 HAD family phosphatase [Elusimicrobiota bacterium]MDE2425065.1 HAD family phosphatase [Elusimicrobiota bacterium]
MPEGASIDAVFFDIGNVLLRFDMRAMAAKLAWAVRRHPIRVMRRLLDAAMLGRIERGELSGAQIYALFQSEFGYSGSYDAFIRIWCDHFSLERANYALLRQLSRSRRVYLLSNTNALHYEFIRGRYAFPRQVDGAVLSYQLGLRKPQPAIYEAAVALAGSPPERCLFIDDLAENVAAARRCGLNAIHHVPGRDLRAAVGRLGLLGPELKSEA